MERRQPAVTKFITDFINSNGVYAVLFLMTIESCGIPFPSEVIMPFAGWLAFGGHLSFIAAVIAGALGNLIGSLIAYGIAAKFGEPVLLGPFGRRIGIRKSHVEMADRWFQRYGLMAVFFGRIMPVVRTYISFPAGLARVRLAPFAVLTFLGALPWCAALAGAGYKLGANWDHVSGPIEKVAIVLAVLVVGAVIFWFVRGRREAAGAA
jgi:membrane protein DedA with SNARE-associated domain